MVNQSTQTDPKLIDTDDHLARVIRQCCGASAVNAYNQGQPIRLGDIHVEQH